MIICQDNNLAIEKAIAESCGLIHRPKQNDVDAIDVHGNSYEIKHTASGSNSFGTSALDYTLEKLKNMRSVYWIGAIIERIGDGKVKIMKTWLIDPSHLSPVFDNVEEELRGRAVMAEEFKKWAKTHRLFKHDLKGVEGFAKRGSSHSNFSIPVKYFRNGVSIDMTNSERATLQVTEYVESHPIEKIVEDSHIEFVKQFMAFT